jgi:hypothetical protein
MLPAEKDHDVGYVMHGIGMVDRMLDYLCGLGLHRDDVGMS